MSYKDDFNIFIGAEYGKFKGVKASESGTIVKSIQSLNHLKSDGHITALAWGSEDEDEILLGLSDQTVKIYDSDSKCFTLSLDAKFTGDDAGIAPICGISRYNGIVVAAVESGHVGLMKCDDENPFHIHAGGPISKMRHSKTFHNIIGTGGLENELKLWDLNTGKNTFTAKNVPNDHLQLRVKVWVTDHVFMPASDKIVVGSRYGYVRMYDPKAQKRPVVKVDIPDQAVTCITSSNIENTVLCGLAKGNIASVDLRMGRTSKTYKGFVGGVRDIVCHPTEPYIASVGLDRFVRVHDVFSKEVLVKEYVVSRMNCILMRSNFTIKSNVPKSAKKSKKRGISKELLSDGTSDHEEAQQLDEMFNSMEKVIDGKNRKKRPSDGQPGKTIPENPSKKRKSLLLVNPFASKSNGPITDKDEETRNVPHLPKNESDSDDDIMIVSETVSQSHSNSNEEQKEESEADEAEGDSDELDEDSDSEGGSYGEHSMSSLNNEDTEGR